MSKKICAIAVLFAVVASSVSAITLHELRTSMQAGIRASEQALQLAKADVEKNLDRIQSLLKICLSAAVDYENYESTHDDIQSYDKQQANQLNGNLVAIKRIFQAHGYNF
jgi:ketopantoate reductase